MPGGDGLVELGEEVGDAVAHVRDLLLQLCGLRVRRLADSQRVLDLQSTNQSTNQSML